MSQSRCYGWAAARVDFEAGVYPARIARWLDVSESAVWAAAREGEWRRPSSPTSDSLTADRPVVDRAAVAVVSIPYSSRDSLEQFIEMASRSAANTALLRHAIGDASAGLDEPVTWRDLPPVAYLTPLAFAALSLLSQVNP